MKLTRSKFDQLTEALVERLVAPVNRALQDANLKPGDLDEVVLVGGSTRMPMVQELVRRLTGKEPNKSVNPDEVVAVGAALQAGVLAGDVHDVLLLDVTPLSLGLETMGGVMTTLIPRNTTIPTRKSELFSTAEDNQTAVDIHVLQGERPMATDNNTLGVFRLEGLPAAPRGIPQVEVTFDIDANGILNVTAKDEASGRSQAITITASTNLSESEIQNLVHEAEQHSAEDTRRRTLVEARNTADQVAYQTEKSLGSLNGSAPEGLRVQLENQIAALREAMAGEDAARISELTAALQQAAMVLGEAAYQMGGETTAGPAPEGHAADESDEDIIEGEFEAV
jgi:molecular chaperone DnaK